MKILVVDDEVLVNQYVVQCITASGDIYQVVGTTTSGAKALKILKEKTVDLVFVDITMPKMDGLELLRQIKENYPSVMVVMLTCHDEFAYAQQAIQNHADNYVLKTEMTPEYMKKVLEDLQNTRKTRRLAQQTGQLKRNDYLKKLGGDSKDITVITESDLRRNDIFLREDAFIALCFDNQEGNLDAVWSAVEKDYENPVVYIFNEDLTVLLLNIRRFEQHREKIDVLGKNTEEYFAKIGERLQGRLGHSRMFLQMDQLREAIDQALEDHNDRFYGVRGKGGVDYEERGRRLQWMMAQAAIRVEEKNWEQAKSVLQGAVDYARQVHVDAALLKRSMKRFCAVLTENCGADLTACRQRLQMVDDFDDFTAATAMLEEALSRQGKTYSGAIAGALQYIEQNYAEDLTLQMVAEHVFLNREYFSRRFKKEVGVTFSEYLTSLRLKRAKELLEMTGMRISEVAAQVGIPSVSYFSTIFRKEFQCAPSDLRPRNKGKMS